MAGLVVVDSSILTASVLEETLTTKANHLLSTWKSANVQLYAPFLFRYEIVASMRKAVYRKRISEERGLDLSKLLLKRNIKFYLDDSLLERAYQLASQLKRMTAYDSQYLALAERLNCEFWTVDEKLFNASKG